MTRLQEILKDVNIKIISLLQRMKITEKTVNRIDSEGSLIVPDYAKMETINRITRFSDEWTADRTGFVRCLLYCTSSSGRVINYIAIDNQAIYVDGEITNDMHYVCTTIPILKGQTVSMGNAVDQDSIIIETINCYFIPPKAIKNAVPIVAENFENFMTAPDYGNADSENHWDILWTGNTEEQRPVWVADRDGYVNISVVVKHSASGTLRIMPFIDDVMIDLNYIYALADTWYQKTILVPILKGQKVSFQMSSSSSSNIVIDSNFCQFIPPKFAKVSNPVIEMGGDYSLEEQPVLINENGVVRQKLWLDGKPIWRMAFPSNFIIGDVNDLSAGETRLFALVDIIPNIERIVDECIFLTIAYISSTTRIGNPPTLNDGTIVNNVLHSLGCGSNILIKNTSNNAFLSSPVHALHLGGWIEYTKA